MSKKRASKKPARVTKPFWIGFDLGGTKMLAVVFDAEFNVLGSARKSTQGGDTERGLKRICATIAEAMAEAHVVPARLRGIGIACPGTVNSETGVLINAPNLGWKKV